LTSSKSSLANHPMSFEKVKSRFPNASITAAGLLTIPALGVSYPSKIALRIAAGLGNQAGKAFEKVNPFTKPTTPTTPVTSNKTVITATYSVLPAIRTAAYPILKYDKWAALNVMFDDGGATDYADIYPVLHGGKSSSGATWPGITYGDGTGKQLRPGATFALTSLINGLDSRTTGDNPQVTTYAQYNTMLAGNYNLCASNHSSRHSSDDPAGELAEAQAALTAKLGVTPRTVTVPGGFGGYVGAMKANPVYLAAISEGYGSNRENADGYGDQIQYLDAAFIPNEAFPLPYVLSRRFINQDWATTAKNWIDEKFQLATDKYNAGQRAVLSCFDHFPASQTANLAAFYAYVKAHPLNVGGDNVWFCNLQEFVEWQELKAKCPLSAPVVSGNTLTWTIDRSTLPAYSLNHDASVLVPTAGLQSVSVDGADSFTVNTSSGLVNAYKLNAVVAAVPTTPSTPTTPTTPSTPTTPIPTPLGVTPGVDSDPKFALWETGTRITGKIPLTAKDFYFVKDVHDGDFGALVDGSTAPYYGGARVRNVSPVKAGLRKYRAKVSYLKLTTRLSQGPTLIYYVAKGSWEKTLIGSVSADTVGVSTLTLPTPLTDCTYLVIQPPAHSDYPSEVEVWGSYVNPAPVVPIISRRTLKQLFGSNAFTWDGNGKGGGIDVGPDTFNPLKKAALRQNGIIRHYLDRVFIEPEEGKIMLAPSSEIRGSFNLDVYYQGLFDAGIDVRACIKNAPGWVSDTWPAELRTSEQLTVKWQGSLEATQAWAERPEAYLSGGKLWFQFGARYGTKVVPDNLLNVFQTANGAFPGNQKRTGLGLVKKVEFGNEPDSDWRGQQGYATGRMIAAMCSAYLDGHCGTLGAGVGVCTADPDIDASFPGIATATLETLQGAVDWCREFRGYNADGTVNLSWKKANFHAYSTDGGITQVGIITRGRAPEPAGYVQKMTDFIQFSAEDMGGMGVILGEHGTDVSEKSSQGAVRPIDMVYDAQGNILYYPEYNQDGSINPDRKVVPLRKQGADRTTRYLVQAQWATRERLLGWLTGLAEMQFYMHKDASTPPSEFDRYSACGSTNDDETLRVSGYFSYQFVHTFGDYYVTEVLSTAPYVVKSTDGVKTAYFIWNPTETDATAPYTLPAAANGYTKYTPSINSTSFATSAASATGVATETPIVMVVN
jgi:hypothetical protein